MDYSKTKKIERSLYTLSEALEFVPSSKIKSTKELLEEVVRGGIRLCIKVPFELGNIGLADLRLHWEAREMDVDIEIKKRYEFNNLFLPDEIPIDKVTAFFLDLSTCEAILNHQEVHETIFSSAYQIKSHTDFEEITPFDIQIRYRILDDEGIQTLREISKLQKFAVFAKTPRVNQMITIGEESNDFIENPRPICIILTIEKLCITCSELKRFIEDRYSNLKIDSMLENVVSSQENFNGGAKHRVSKKLEELNKAKRKFCKPCIEEASNNGGSKEPLRQKIIDFLVDSNEYSNELAGHAATIIYPHLTQEKQNGTNSPDYTSKNYQILIAAAELHWPQMQDENYIKPLSKQVAGTLASNGFAPYLAKAGAAILNLYPSKLSQPKKYKSQSKARKK